MKKLWYLIYDMLFYPVFQVLILIASLLNKKIKRGLKARKKIISNLIIEFTDLDKTKPLIWVHSSSMGEFEQAKPIIEKLKKEYSINILVTFFSPSGYENSLKYKFADIISYLPLDKTFDLQKFTNITNPKVVILMRYDVWPNMIKVLSDNKIPILLVDATMRSNSKRRIPIIKQFNKIIFNQLKTILTISEEDKNNFLNFDLDKPIIKSVGDTRFDRVYQKSIEASSKNIINTDIIKDKKVIILGSSWEADENVVLPALLKLIKYDSNVLIIIVPHEPTISKIDNLEATFYKKTNTIRFSHLNNYKDERVIIVDSIGILLSLYYYADIAYVGGSFKQGIHNVLEPAVYGIPVIYGPKIENSQEAKKMITINAGFVVHNKKEAYKIFRELTQNETKRKEYGENSKKYVLSNIGATEKIIQEVKTYLK